MGAVDELTYQPKGDKKNSDFFEEYRIKVYERRKAAGRLKTQLADFERRVRERFRDAEARMLEQLESGDPYAVRGTHYDVVLNGVELGSGSLRNHRSDVQRRVFEILGYAKQETEERFGFLWVHPQPDGVLDVDALLASLAVEFKTWSFERLVLTGEDVYETPLNWKLAIDTFGETYHFKVLHRDIQR